MRDLVPKQKTNYFQRFLSFLGFVFIILIIVGVITKKDIVNNGPKQADIEYNAPATNATLVTVSAKDYFKDYQENEVTADEKYKENAIGLTGRISDIKKDFTGQAYITMNIDDYGLQFVMVYLKDINDAKQLKKGQRATFYGIGGGMVVNTPNIKNAFVKQ